MMLKQKKVLSAALLFLLAASFALAIASGNAEPVVMDGAALFNSRCSKCHGLKGVGTDKGPPLVHKIYEPNHHADMSFYWAAERGVRAHHWGFGDMPPVEGVSKDDVSAIIKYIRGLQKEAGIF
ncbi:MAG: cytochrome c [Deltaproteobacteria bacterium]|nr:cytochrome c [Deltaproteobacteria bacterium]